MIGSVGVGDIQRIDVREIAHEGDEALIRGEIQRQFRFRWKTRHQLSGWHSERRHWPQGKFTLQCHQAAWRVLTRQIRRASALRDLFFRMAMTRTAIVTTAVS